MCDEWMPDVKLRISVDEFHQLPRNAAYKYEYLEGDAYLTPRPKFYHGLLDLERFQSVNTTSSEFTLRSLQDDDLGELEVVLAAAFARQPPFSGVDRNRRLEAARQVIAKVRDGGDGPWIRQASFVACAKDGEIIGGILITLLPDEDPADWDSFHWSEPPPTNYIERRMGRPHVTWVFVTPMQAGFGVGTALLVASVTALRSLGFAQLASTFISGNDSSMLWHWRNGFQLQTYPGSRRRRRHLKNAAK